MGVSFDILKDPDYYYWTFELCNGSICLTNTKGYLGKKLKGLRNFWIMYKTSSSALSLTSDREWKPQCQECTARLRKKRGANGIFQNSQEKYKVLWGLRDTTDNGMERMNPGLYMQAKSPVTERENDASGLQLISRLWADSWMNTTEKEKKSQKPQWSLGIHFRHIRSSLRTQPGLKLDRQPNHPCWGWDVVRLGMEVCQEKRQAR